MLALQETFLTNVILDTSIIINGYSLYRFDRTHNSGKKSGGGLAIYASNKYVFEHLHKFDICQPDLEVMWVKMSLPSTRDTYIVNMYKPPEGNADNTIHVLEGQIGEIMGRNNPDIILLGDTNIDLKKLMKDAKSLKKLRNSHEPETINN